MPGRKAIGPNVAIALALHWRDASATWGIITASGSLAAEGVNCVSQVLGFVIALISEFEMTRRAIEV